MIEPPRWYAVRTLSNREKRVSSIFRDKSLENYFPTFQEVHQWKDRKKVVELPIFPGYLFVRTEDSKEARIAVLRTQGVVGILGQGERIEPVPDHEIEAVRQLFATTSGFRTHPLLQEGARVRVTRGALKGIEGLLARIKNQSRLVLSITLLSQSVSTEIDVTDVQVLSSASLQSRTTSKLSWS